MEYAVALPQFQGPLDLLLHLIRTEEMDIHDIPILNLVEQYRTFLERMEQHNLTVAGEYLYMLSVLISIKARMLLPRREDSETPDPREPLVHQLLAYEAVKKAADDLAHRHTMYGGMIGRQVEQDVFSLDDVTLYDLAEAFSKVLARLESEKTEHFVPGSRPSVRDSMISILDKLPLNGHARSLKSILKEMVSRIEVITSFIAILELSRLGGIRVLQPEPNAPIYLKRRKKDVTIKTLENYQ